MGLLKSIAVKGSLGLHYGMGVDEVKVNFADVDGLITLAGSNGHGKTSFLEMLSPFPVFPSRQLKDPRRYNYKKQFQLKDSYKEVVYDHNGHEYRFRIEIPATTKTKGPEGYIWEDGTPMVKGKITQYKKKVEELFGSENLFYSSVFSCQGGKKLTDLPVGEFKQLLIELLGLKKYTEYFNSVGKCLAEVNLSMKEVDRDLDRLGEKENHVAELQSHMKRYETTLYTETSQKNTADVHINNLTQEIDGLTFRIIDTEKKEALIQEKVKRVQVLDEELGGIYQDSETEKAAYQEHCDNFNATLKPHRDLVAMSAQIQNAAVGLKKVRTEETEWNEQSRLLTAQRTNVVKGLDGIQGKLIALDKRMVGFKNDKVLTDREAVRDGLLEELEENKRSIRRQDELLRMLDIDTSTMVLEKEMEAFVSDDYLLQRRPEACTIDDCPFIQKALSSIPLRKVKEKAIAVSKTEFQKKIEGIQSEKGCLEDFGEMLNLSLKQIVEVIDERNKEMAAEITAIALEAAPLIKKVKTIETVIAEIDKEYSEIIQYLDGVPARVSALESLSSKSEGLASAQKVIALAVETLAADKEAYEKLIEKLRLKYASIQTKTKALREELFNDGLIAPSSALKEELTKVNSTKRNWEAALDMARTNIQELEKKMAVCKENIKIADQHGEELIRLKHRRAFLLEELSKWSYIRDAVSKSGLQALEIASAAPLMTSKANDLLHAAYGGEFFLDLVTLDPETGVEILDIMVTRGDGKTFPLFAYSGGESVWILQAFKAAQILINAEKSGIHFATCFADEESGALDKEKAERFILMYRALMDQGNFKKLFYISHIPECQAMADHSLVFEDGGIKSESNIFLPGE